MKAKKTTYVVDGCKEPCYEIASDDGFVKIRLAPYYHYFGKKSVLATEFLDGKFNSQEELDYSFDKLTTAKSKVVAKMFSVYLN